MKLDRPDRKILIRYALLQIPSSLVLVAILVYARFMLGFSWTIFLIILGLWFLKDGLLFPFVWRSYHKKDHVPGESLLGKEGVVVRSPGPEGMVRIGPELWRARLEEGEEGVPDVGDLVRVTRIQGLVVHIRADTRSGS